MNHHAWLSFLLCIDGIRIKVPSLIRTIIFFLKFYKILYKATSPSTNTYSFLPIEGWAEYK
jgi:hypothetical protein